MGATLLYGVERQSDRVTIWHEPVTVAQSISLAKAFGVHRRDFHLQTAGSRIVDDLFQLARRCVIDPFLAALRTNGRIHFSRDDYTAAEIGAECGFAFCLFAAADWANLIRIAHDFLLVR